MANRLNVNLVLCRKYDDEEKTINNMFNKITTNNKHEATFSVITFVNGIDNADSDEQFVLHYFLVKMEDDENGGKKGLYLGATAFFSRSSNKNSDELSSNNTFSELTFEDVPFIGEGRYRIEAYKVMGSLGENKDYEKLREKALDFRKNGEYVSFASFIVKYQKD